MSTDTEKYNIICLSNQIWNYPLWTNKKHVMSRLAKDGHNVLFVDPPINMLRLFVKQVLDGKWNWRRLLTLQFSDLGVNVVSPLRPFPGTGFEEKSLSGFYAGFINGLASKKLDPERKTILWVYHVELVGLRTYIKDLDFDILVYDCVDNYVGFPTYNTPEKKKWLMDQEEYLTKMADVVFTTAPGIYERLKKLNPNTYYTPNVGDYQKFKNARTQKTNIPDDIKFLQRPIVGFTGALDEYKFDSALVRKAALENPNITFVLIGPIALKDREGSLQEVNLDGIPNIHYLGTRDFSIIQNYFSGFDAFMIPYQLNDYTVGGCFPIKFHDSLAAGLPVVVTDMPAYMSFENVCYISKSPEEFCRNLVRAIEEDNPVKTKERQDVAKQHSWEGKVETMLSYIAQALENKSFESNRMLAGIKHSESTPTGLGRPSTPKEIQ